MKVGALEGIPRAQDWKIGSIQLIEQLIGGGVAPAASRDTNWPRSLAACAKVPTDEISIDHKQSRRPRTLLLRLSMVGRRTDDDMSWRRRLTERTGTRAQ